MKSVDTKARIYLILIVLAGSATIIYSFLEYDIRWNIHLFAFTVMAALIGPASVKIGSKIEMSPVFPFSFCALLLYGVSGAIFVGIVNVLSTSLLRKNRLHVVKIIFNIFSVSIALFGTGLAFDLVCTGEYALSNESFLSGVLLATLTFYLVNTFLVTGIVTLTERESFFHLWRERFVWTAPSYFAGSSCAVGFAFLIDRFGTSVVILALPPSVLIYYFYRFYIDSNEEKKKLRMTIKQLQQANGNK